MRPVTPAVVADRSLSMRISGVGRFSSRGEHVSWYPVVSGPVLVTAVQENTMEVSDVSTTWNI